MNNMMQMFQTFMNNPSQFVSKMGFPADIQNNPQAMIQHLMNTGRLSQDQYNRLQQMAKQFNGFLK